MVQDNTVSVISDNTNTVIATIPVGGYPYGVAYDSAKGEIFVVNLHDNNVMVISDSTNAVVATIPVGQSPYNIAYDSAKGELFVTNLLRRHRLSNIRQHKHCSSNHTRRSRTF